QLARGLVERGFVLPSLHWIEQVRLDAGHRGRHRETEIGIGAEAHASERAIERAGDERARRFDRHAPADPLDAPRPTPSDPPAHSEMPSQQSTPCLEMYSRSRLPYSAGGRGRNGAAKQVENSGCSPTRPFSVPATLAV